MICYRSDGPVMPWKHEKSRSGARQLLGLICLALLMVTLAVEDEVVAEETAVSSASHTRRVNAPYWQVKPPHPYATHPAIFWFGRVDNTNNYADGRIIYNDTHLYVTIHIMDRRLWYDTNPSPANLVDWDAVTLYLNLSGNAGPSPGSSAYQFVAQLNHWQPRENYQAAYRGNGSGWSLAAIPFTTTTGWRGVTLNDNSQDARGWLARFIIPFASLGLPAAPVQGTVWGLAVAVHDRDDATGTPIPDVIWPEAMSGSAPSSWGQLRFGLPSAGNAGLTTRSDTIRHGLNGAQVVDGHVGGHTVCGSAHHPAYFPSWGSANYQGYGEINIQNQWDIADWPCFSKYFVTFPLDITPPTGKVLLRATLIMHQFGSAWGAEVEPSWIQALTVREDWQEANLTWNNAPLAEENLSGTWVEPLGFPGWPGVPRTWDVTKGVIEALAVGEPLRLALYSADGAYHSGRYFSSSDAGDWNVVARPTLRLEWGDLCGGEVRCLYLPTVIRN